MARQVLDAIKAQLPEEQQGMGKALQEVRRLTDEIKALKRKIEMKSGQFGESDTEVKTGHGGIRDVEFTIQFLQLLNGGDLPVLRQRNTLAALQALEEVGCLTDQEYRVLDDAYRFLRKTEHRLQLLFDLQTHRLPEENDELRKLALRMGYKARGERREARDESIPSTSLASSPSSLDPYDAFLEDYREKTALNRTILYEEDLDITDAILKALETPATTAGTQR